MTTRTDDTDLSSLLPRGLRILAWLGPVVFMVLVSMYGGGRMWPVIAAVPLCLSIFVAMTVTRSVRALLVWVAVFAVVFSIAQSNWPFRLAYLVSRPALERLAKAAKAGETPPTPVRAGAFLIRKIEVARGGIVCLWTAPNPSGNGGFVQCPAARPPFNLWSHFSFDDHWQYIVED